MTPRVRKALEALIFGIEGHDGAMTHRLAAEHAGIGTRAMRQALTKPKVIAEYRALLAAFREGERGNNLRVASQIRDDAGLKASAAGQRVRLLAAAQLDSDLADRNGINVNVGVAVKVETPGYVIRLRRRDDPLTIDHGDHDIGATPGARALATAADASDEGRGPFVPADAIEGGGGQNRAAPVEVHPSTRAFPAETFGPENISHSSDIQETDWPTAEPWRRWGPA